MSKAEYWQRAYGSKAPADVSWYSEHLEPSMVSIRSIAAVGARIIDVGGGASTLVDDLLAASYSDISVLDISSAALDAAKARQGEDAKRVSWIVGDITRVDLPDDAYDVWHDRAVFHFLTEAADRQAYVDRVTRSLKHGGRVVIATFAPDGPARCSGLDVVRYDAGALARELGSTFVLEEAARVTHRTPAGSEQNFIHCVFRKVGVAG